MTLHGLGATPAHNPPPSPQGPKCSQFHAVFGKIWQDRVLAPPPTGNPGPTPA